MKDLSLKKAWLVLPVLVLSILFVFNNCDIAAVGIATLSSSNNDGGASDPGNSGNNDNGNNTPPPTTESGTYFSNNVLPALRSRCVTCHERPQLTGRTDATLAIYNYAFMRSKIEVGPTATNNPLFNKIRNVVSHVGGDQCPNDIKGSVSPCREIKEWTKIEFPQYAEGIAGRITVITLLGEVHGWARDPLNLDSIVNVSIYANGPAGTGQLVTTTLANQPGVGSNNGHYFRFVLPANLRNGTEQRLWAYGNQANLDNLMDASPFTYVAVTPSAAGEAYYTNTLAAAITCRGCHTWTYSRIFELISDPLPLRGGTGTNNLLFNKMRNIVNHNGGNVCQNGANNPPCSLVQEFYRLNYGP